jgi:VWFA-related protein
LLRVLGRSLLLGLVLGVSTSGSTGAAQAPSPDKPAAPPTFRVDTGVVMLDVVVRDKKGRLVRDLRPEEVQVFEDGVKQEVTGFRFVETGREAAPAAAGAPVPAPARPEARQISLVTLLFDQLGPEPRLIARKAAIDFLESDHRPDLWISVFLINRRMQLLQQFTQDRDEVRLAVERATGGSYEGRTDLTADAARVGREGTAASSAADASAAGVASGGAGAGAAGAASGAAARDAAFAQIEQNTLDMTDRLERQLQGESSIFGLMALANQQQKLAGRKTILYFSEGLQVTSRLEQVFRSAVSEANRANVSIYAVDARGLNTQNQSLGSASQQRLERAQALVRRQQMTRGGVAVTPDEVMAGETVEEALRSNTQGTLGDLAESTGGFLIANTNDMKAGMERVAGDIVGYYEVVYAPTKVETDGKFRELEVKVARGGTNVQARKGYFAVPAGEGTVTFPYELSLLSALRQDPVPHDFDFHASALRFAREPQAQQYTLVMEVPLSSFAFKKEGGSYKAHFSFMAVLRHPTQGVVQKFSQDSPVEVPAEKKEALTRGNAIFTRSFSAAPGRYTLETVAQDENSKKTSVRKAVLLVPKVGPPLGLSSLAIIKRTEPVNPGALESDDALRVGQTRIVPELGEPTLQAGDGLPLFLVVYPVPGAADKPELTLALLLEGALVGRSTPELPKPDDKGEIAYIATIPSKGLAPGRYEVRAILRQGASAAEETTFFNIGAKASASAEAPPGKVR